MSTLASDDDDKERSVSNFCESLIDKTETGGQWDEAYFALIEDLLVKKIK